MSASLLNIVCVAFAILPTVARAESDTPLVTTGPAQALGTSGMSVDGSIHPHGVFTTYFFEYGATEKYGLTTPAAPLPPRLAAFYRESWDEGTGGWYAEGAGPLAHIAEGGAAGGFVRYSEPGRHDPNHDDGIGTVHLSKYLYTGPWGDFVGKATPYLAAGDADLRDAKVSIHVRGMDWIPNGTELAWWSQSQSNIELLNQPGWQHANWAYTGFLLTDALHSGAFETVEYRLRNNAADWTYAGDNPRTRGRYTYWPIDQTQGHNNLDFFHMVVNVDPANPPRGEIDFDEFELAYRNHSLLLPSNGGRLVSAPDSLDDPATLTDGWRNGPGRTWRGPENPASPFELVYAFNDPVTIRAAQVHQHPEWPAQKIELLTSQDGETYAPLFAKTLPEKGIPNANFAFSLATGLDAPARFLKLRVLSGYQDLHWGLGEIEVFGEGAHMLPDDDLYHVTADVPNLESGRTYHYRLVAEQDGKTFPGEDRTFTVPATQAPHVVTGGAMRIGVTSATVQGRLNSLGLATEFYFEYGSDSRYGHRTPNTYGGLQITPRTVNVALTGLPSGSTLHYRLVAVNERGTSQGEDAVFNTTTE